MNSESNVYKLVIQFAIFCVLMAILKIAKEISDSLKIIASPPKLETTQK